MDIKEFVRDSIIQIVSGVAEAQEELSNHRRVAINPTLGHANYANPENIHFDLAVTVQEQLAVEGKVKGGIAVVSADVNAEKKSNNMTVSRISFNVPVALPSTARHQYDH